MKEQYITITGIKHYYGIIPFEIGRKITCVKDRIIIMIRRLSGVR